MTQERLMKASAFTCEQEPCLEEERWVMGSGWAQPRIGGHEHLDHLKAEDRENQLGPLSRDVPFQIRGLHKLQPTKQLPHSEARHLSGV